MKSFILAGVLIVSAAQINSQAMAMTMTTTTQLQSYPGIFYATALAGAQPTGGSCANFSGHWKGICSTNGLAKSESVTITQIGCDYLSMDRLFFAIGGSRSEAHTIPSADGTVTTLAVSALNWNEDRASLNSLTDIKIDKAGVGTTYVDRVVGGARLTGGHLYSWLKGSNFQTVCDFQ
jgi:hypothetical protein